MKLYRSTYLEIDLKNIENNVKEIIKEFSNYQYYFGVVKADCYGHQEIQSVEAVIKGGCNYLCVATLEEALWIREIIKDIPILCLGVIPTSFLSICKENQITITIPSLVYMEELQKLDSQNLEGLKVHFKINTGMNRLGIKTSQDLEKVYELAQIKNLNIEGIYTHIYEASCQDKYEKQMKELEIILKVIPLSEIPIIHVAASDTFSHYDKPSYVNGCRLGIIIYGFTNRKDLKLESTCCLQSQVIQINELNPGETVGYNGMYQAKQREKIAVVSIGYADGIIRKNTGRMVYIKGKEYPIIGNICMDMLFVKIDDNVKLYDQVTILKDRKHIEEVANYLGTIPYEVLCSIGKRVPRIYKNNSKPKS